ncbi:MAG: DUF1553 domain-containing protein [Planctomycetota bacterium]|nr:DUF1553 domain-containing protein [Planctomycetota bacterium]
MTTLAILLKPLARRISRLLVAILASAMSSSVSAQDPPAQQVAFFEQHVRPLLLKRCVSCHGPKKREAGLRLDRADGLFRSTDRGAIVKPNKPEESRLIRLIRADGEDLAMPPAERLSKQEIKILTQWVHQGALWPGYDNTRPRSPQSDGPLFTAEQKSYWAFQPIALVRPPQLNDRWISSPVDTFIRARLQNVDLTPASSADAQTRLRRVTFDLTGLPPTSAEIAAFTADVTPDAWPRLIDRKLASPAYGEKWGRHWLDVVRFAESAAHDGNNGYLHAWRYRDYVIDAINRDHPYNAFVIEQLAGDLLPQTGDAALDLERLVATGFLQVGPKPVVMRDKRQMLLDIADEQLSTTTIALLGLTVGCARCHDHKFDPIPTEDYYSLAGIFTSTHVMHDMAADSMWIEPEVPGPDGEVIRVMAVRDQPQAANLRIHLRGNYRTLGAEAPRRFLQIIAGENHSAIETKASGRLELARWIADERNPLTARVLVNRLWQRHFGRGIVATADDFGVRGETPSHPELLDWLAHELVDRDWSMKAVQRILLQSATYQQSASVNDRRAATLDADNRLLWRMPRRRLSAEEIRDSLLFASQMLDRQMGGTLFTSGYNFNRPDVKLSVVDIGDPENYAPFHRPRRSVYLPVIRNQMHPMLALFDTANEHIPVTKRTESIVAPQALFLMNSSFARQAARRLALSTTTLPDARRIREIYLRLLGREPTRGEQAESQDYVGDYRQALGLDPVGVVRAPVAVQSYADQVRNTPGLLAYYRLNAMRTIDGQAVTPNALRSTRSPGRVVNGATFGVAGAVLDQPGEIARDTAIELNGVNQRIQVDDVAFLGRALNAITVEYWIKPARVAQQYGVGLDDLATDKRYWKSGLHPVQVEGREQLVIYHEFFHAGGFRFPRNKEAVVATSQWSHVVFSLGAGARKLFVNGQLVDTFNTTARPTFGGAPLTFGSRADDNEWLEGGIDEVAIYNQVLDEHTIRSHFLAGSGQTLEALHPDLLAWQSFCQAVFCMNGFIFVD